MEFESLRDIKLKGIAKLLHQLFLFVTYPLRHPFKFLVVLLIVIALLIAVPLFNGTSFSQIYEWYASKFSANTEQEQVFKETPIGEIEQKPTKFAKQIKLKHAKVDPQKIEAKAQEQAEEPQKYATWNIQKKPEKKVQQAKEIVVPVVEEANVETNSQPQRETNSQPQKVEYKKVEGLALKYLDNPQIIYGTPIIYGANELYMADTYMYLYGIYTDPAKYDAKKATTYLNELISGEKIECHIVAKTLDDIATAICLKNGRSINQNLVDAGMADNVAL